MDEDVDDEVGHVAYTDSQNSIPIDMICYETSDDIGLNSTGRDTYILEIDDSMDTINSEGISRTVSTTSTNVPLQSSDTPSSFYTYVQETFTQTSKTLIEVARAEMMKRVTTAETQTSLLRLIENKTATNIVKKTELTNTDQPERVNKHSDYISDLLNGILNQSIENSSDYPAGDTEREDVTSDATSKITKDTYKISDLNRITENNKTKFDEGDRLSSEESQESDSDYEADSLMGDVTSNTASKSRADDQSSIISDVAQSVDNEVKELYDKVTENLFNPEQCNVDTERKAGFLATLSEETTPQGSNMQIDTTKTTTIANTSIRNDADDFFLNSLGFQVKLLPRGDESSTGKADFKLPPINRNSSCPNSPHLNLLLTVNKPFAKADTLPCLFQVQKENMDRWKIFASGKNGHFEGRKDSSKSADANNFKGLPPIRTIVGHVQALPASRPLSYKSNASNETRPSSDSEQISIKEKIRELKMTRIIHRPNRMPGFRQRGSPSLSTKSAGDEVISERACDLICQEMLKRLRAGDWFEVVDTLDGMSTTLDKFWSYMSEQRIADCIRLICTHTESPRSQVSKSACAALAELLKNTKYTKKPEFYEAMSILLHKTGSYSRQVKRSANLALDKIVCNVDLSQAICALCLHGVDHKSPLVRSAAARLLVVTAALSGGGRDLLRTRPAAAAAARRHALRALAQLLSDKSTDARKYAARLYMMLRPLMHFEAYYLTDVNVELASSQMKKYDQLLMMGNTGDW